MFALFTETTTTVYATEAEARAAQTVHPERLGSSVAPIDAAQWVAVTVTDQGETWTIWEGPAANSGAAVTDATMARGSAAGIAIVVPAGMLATPRREAPAAPADGVTVRKLSGSNVDALKRAQDVGLEVATTATTATFPGTVRDALEALESATETLAARHGRRGHPVASIHAVRRRLEAL